MFRNFAAALAIVVSLPMFATEPNPSARQRVLVGKLLELIDVNKSSASVMDSMLGHVEKQFLADAEAKGNKPADIAEARETFIAFRQKVASIDFAVMMNEAFIRIYSKYFTEKELEELVAFYGTPVGRKSIEVMGDLAREGMEAASHDLVPRVEKIMAEVIAEQEKKRPWRRTMADIRSVATAVEAYAIDNDDLYPAGDYASLQKLLVPEYLGSFPAKDIWGHEYAYAVSPDRTQYRLVSAGADSIFDWDSRRIVAATGETDAAPAVRYRDRLEDDIIFADGVFLQVPVQAKIDDEN